MDTKKGVEDSTRRRVCKACDRCRLKKSKCDGTNPCSRCHNDNAICVFGQRKKLQDRVHPKGYAEMLEQQQTQLAAGLQELYSRLLNGESWPGEPLQKTLEGHPLTHDILERLSVLHSPSSCGSDLDCLENDYSRMQSTVPKRLALVTPSNCRHRLASSDLEHTQVTSSSSYQGTTTTELFSFDSPPSCNSLSQTISPTDQEIGMIASSSMKTDSIDLVTLLSPAGASYSMMDEPKEFTDPIHEIHFLSNFDPTIFVDTNVKDSKDPMLSDWGDSNDLDFTKFT